MRVRKTAWIISAALLALGSAGAGPLAADEVAVLAGSHDPFKDGSTVEIGLEYRRPLSWRHFVWVAGAAGTGDGAAWIYSGLQRPFDLGSGWEAIPGFAFELYDEGSDGKDLGGVLEFRSSLELSRRVSAQTRVGLSVYHVSNAGFYDKNPGHNSLVLVVTRTLK